MSSLTKENIPHLCRACLRNLMKNKVQHITGDQKQQEPTFYHIDRTQNLHKWMTIINPLEDMTRLKNTQQNEHYPEYVCRSCYENFKHLNDFKEMVVHSFSVLTKLLANDEGKKQIPQVQQQQPVMQGELVIKSEPLDIDDEEDDEDDEEDIDDDDDDDDEDDKYMENDWELEDATMVSNEMELLKNIKLVKLF